MMDRKIAVLLTCFNRIGLTKNCLENLFKFDVKFNVYLVDDGSNDGTSEFVKTHYPSVNVIKGSGDLYWTRGMYLAWSEAVKHKKYDFYLWLNNDVYLKENAFSEILECSRLKENKAVISGVIESKLTSEIIYGGYNTSKKIVRPKGDIKSIQFLNGNFVLVPSFVYEKLGNLDNQYHHDLGDVDYGLRAIKQGMEVVTTRCSVGEGEINTISRERKNNTTLKKRFSFLFSPLGANPKVNFYHRKKHKNIFNACLYFVFLIFLNIIPDNINTFFFGEKYT